jgi:hypothetical protein
VAGPARAGKDENDAIASYRLQKEAESFARRAEQARVAALPPEKPVRLWSLGVSIEHGGVYTNRAIRRRLGDLAGTTAQMGSTSSSKHTLGSAAGAAMNPITLPLAPFLLRTLACPVPGHQRYRLRGARRARSLPPQPGGPVTVQRRVSSRGGLMVARQKIHAGMIHAGKTATVICENNHFRVVIDDETAAVVPRTTTSEVHRHKANATDKRTLARPAPEGQVAPCPK